MDIKVTKGDYNLTMNNGQPAITRNFEFGDGSRIDFSITLPHDPNATLIELHKRSTEHAIALLQSLIKSS